MTSKIDDLRSKIERMDTIPTVPAVIEPLSTMLRLPPEKVKMSRVIELVSYDTTIAAQCLRMANSPLFGRRNTESVRSAVVALGLRRVQAILLGCGLHRIVPADRWAFESSLFWRHSLGCALVSSKLARMIGYPDPEKAYLAGLLHDLGVLVNTLTCTDQYRECFAQAKQRQLPLHEVEREFLGFTHCESGKFLAERWKFSPDLLAVIERHHEASTAASAQPLVSLIHLSDLLCRLRELGYGYYEAIGVDLASDSGWQALAEQHPALGKIDLARLTMDIDGSMPEIVATVHAVFKP